MIAGQQALLAQAHRHYTAGELDVAWSVLSDLKLDASDPLDAPILSLRGMIRRQRGEIAEAVQDAKQVCSLISDDPVAWYNLGVACERGGHIDEAAAAYGQALGRAPEHYASLYNLGTILLLHKDDALEAAELYGRAYALRSGDPKLILNLSVALVILNRHDQAMTMISHVFGCGGAAAAHYCIRGLCNYELGRHADALRDYETALTLDPKLKQAQYNKALLLLLHGDFDRGLALYEAREGLLDIIQVSQ